VAGQTLFLPPVNILERDYPAGIDRQTVQANSPKKGFAAPEPGLAAANHKPAHAEAPVVPASAWASAPGTRVYKVRGKDQWLYHIARQTLGNADRWSELYRLNPNVSPQLPVPEGTEIRLPADARAEP
jgi:Tfp pilus assembly protein FimV